MVCSVAVGSAAAMARVNYYCRSPGVVQDGGSSHLHDGIDERELRAPFFFVYVCFFSFFIFTLSLAPRTWTSVTELVATVRL